MSKNIHLLPKKLISKIAAGEVVERPASVVKELIENSIDANADEITLSIENGGLKEIKVVDNGDGIREEDLEMAFTLHATSKINSLEDLNSISTMGFRGEALSTISSAADIEVHTFNNESKPIWGKFSDSKAIEIKNKPREKGTTISIIDLFRHIPARKKFLSSENTEYKHIYNTFITIAIAFPKIKMTLIKNGKQIISLPKSTLVDRIKQILQRETDLKLIEINYNSPELNITGLVGHPSISSISNNLQYIYINNRSISDKIIYRAIKEGFGSLIPRENKPPYILFLNINPSKVDVNVHPRKSEVRFEDSSWIFTNVKRAIEETLNKTIKTEFTNNFKMDRTSVSRISSMNRYTSEDYSQPSTQRSIDKSLKFTENILKPLNKNYELISEFTDEQNESTSGYIFIGQMFDTYLIFEKEDKFIMIDQHAADERVNFEKLEDMYKKRETVTSKDLLIPYNFKLENVDEKEIERLLKELLSFGFIIEQEGEDYVLKSVPEYIRDFEIPKVIDGIKNDVLEDGISKLTIEQITTKLISTFACHTSIRAGDKVNEYIALDIIKRLMKCRLPFSCPHGRPIVWEMKRSELSKKFLRP